MASICLICERGDYPQSGSHRCILCDREVHPFPDKCSDPLSCGESEDDDEGYGQKRKCMECIKGMFSVVCWTDESSGGTDFKAIVKSCWISKDKKTVKYPKTLKTTSARSLNSIKILKVDCYTYAVTNAYGPFATYQGTKDYFDWLSGIDTEDSEHIKKAYSEKQNEQCGKGNRVKKPNKDNDFDYETQAKKKSTFQKMVEEATAMADSILNRYDKDGNEVGTADSLEGQTNQDSDTESKGSSPTNSPHKKKQRKDGKTQDDTNKQNPSDNGHNSKDYDHGTFNEQQRTKKNTAARKKSQKIQEELSSDVDETEVASSSYEFPKFTPTAAKRTPVEKPLRNNHAKSSGSKDYSNVNEEIVKQNKVIIRNLVALRKQKEEENQIPTAVRYPLLPEFPIKSLDDLKSFERKLSRCVDTKDQLRSFILARIGGKDAGEMIRAIYRRLLTDEVKKKFSWTGVKRRSCEEKFSFRDLETCKLVVETVSSAKGVTEDECKKFSKSHIQHVGQPLKGQNNPLLNED